MPLGEKDSMTIGDLDSHILFEDDAIIVLDKPAGWVVNRSHTYAEPTIQDWMADKLHIDVHTVGEEKLDTDGDSAMTAYGSLTDIFTQRTGIVHRLDKDTSGVLLLAKTPEALHTLMTQFKERLTEKTYVALVHGKVVPQEGIIRLPMARTSGDGMKFAIHADGRMSETQYRVLEHFPGLPKGMHQRKGKSYQGFTYIELMPKTGRTHQIRVHMSAIKHPLVADTLYAGKKKQMLDSEWCPRQFLHAKKLCFTHPVSQERMCVESPLAPDLQQVLDLLQA